MSKEALDYLMSAGVPSASFNGTPPIEHKGRIISFEKQQQRDLDGNKKFWEDGEPMWQLVFTIDTGEIDPSIEGDDGLRKIYAKAQMLGAIREAIKKSGHRGEIVGGMLAVKYTGDGEATKRGFNPPKLYAAFFKAPTQADLVADVAERQEPDGPPPSEYDDYGEEPF